MYIYIYIYIYILYICVYVILPSSKEDGYLLYSKRISRQDVYILMHIEYTYIFSILEGGWLLTTFKDSFLPFDRSCNTISYPSNCIYICAFICTFMYTYKCVFVYVCIYICINIYMCMYIYIYTYTYIYIRIYIFIYTYINMYIVYVFIKPGIPQTTHK